MEEVSVVAELFLIVVSIYLVECVRWVGRSSVGLRSFFPGLWSFVAPWQVAAQWKRALMVTAPWPPLGALHIIDGLPVNVGPQGVTLGGRYPGGWSRPGADAVHVPWTQIDRLKVSDAELHLDKELAVVLGTRRMSSALRRLFAEMKDAPAERRERILEKFLERRMDLEEVRKRRFRWRRWSFPHLLMCNVLLVIFFGAAYLLLFTGFFDFWRLILTFVLMVWSFTALVFEFTAAKVLPHSAQPNTGRKLATFLSPMSLMRSGDELRAELYGDLDALAVGSLYVDRRELQSVARQRLAELSYPIIPPQGLASEPALEDEAWLRQKVQARTQKLLVSLGFDADELARPGFEPDGGSASFCPRCHSQYTTADGVCSNCPGVPLQPFGASAAQNQAA